MRSKKKILWSDYYRIWIVANALLGMAVFGTCLGIVYYKHASRQLISELQRIDKTQQALKVEWSQLLLEQAAWGTDIRIERIAKEQLDMIVPTKNQLVKVRQS